MNKKKHGFSLIELVVFIVVMGIIAASILTSFDIVLRGIPRTNYQATTMGCAINCIEWLYGQRRLNGFNNVSVGTTIPTFCNNSLPSGYTMTANVSNTTFSGDSNYKIITTTVTSPRNLGYANISVIVANY
jgi:prepilin-type N-terminal cleavage/methylation domain-containing protein